MEISISFYKYIEPNDYVLDVKIHNNSDDTALSGTVITLDDSKNNIEQIKKVISTLETSINATFNYLKRRVSENDITT